MTALFTVAVALLAMGLICGALAGSITWGVFGALVLIVGIIIFLGDDA